MEFTSNFMGFFDVANEGRRRITMQLMPFRVYRWPCCLFDNGLDCSFHRFLTGCIGSRRTFIFTQVEFFGLVILDLL